MTEALVFWFTGLSGAGKTTVAEGGRRRLENDGLRILILDGDSVRTQRHGHLGFDVPDIKENNALIARLCERERARYDVIFVPIISPFASSRTDARERLEPGFYEVYCSASLDTVLARDVKGLYAKARNGKIDNMIGYSPQVAYEPPSGADLELDTTGQSPESAVTCLYDFVRSQMTGPPAAAKRRTPARTKNSDPADGPPESQAPSAAGRRRRPDGAVTMPLRKEVLLNRFPLKHVADAGALAKILIQGDPFSERRLDLATRLKCVGFYFAADSVRRLHVTSPRSGSLWSELGMVLAIDLATGGDGEYTYENDIFWPRAGLAYRRLDWRHPMGDFETIFVRSDGPALGKLLYFHSRNPYFRSRCAQLKNMKIVVSTRSIPETLESRYFKQMTDPDLPAVSPDDEDSFDWDKYLADAIEFTNSWGDVLTWHRSIRHYRYEDLKADPVECHKEILDFWGFDVPRECIEEGFRRAHREEMKKRIPPAERATNARVSFRRKDQRGVISEARKRHIIDRLRRELIYDLGHTYDYDTDFGVEYD